MPSNLIDWTKNGERIFKTEIEIEYVHQLKELYKRLHTWLDDNDFKDTNGDKNYETLYWQRDLPSGLTEHHIWWRAWRHPGSQHIEQKEFTWFLKFNFQTIAVSKKEVMHKGKKWKMFQSNTIMRFEAHLIRNWEDDFSGGLLKSIQERWRLWIYKPRIKKAEDELIAKLVEMQNVIKEFLRLSQTQEQPPSIYPPDALP